MTACPGHREGARNQRLAGNDGGDRGEHHHRKDGPVRHQGEERCRGSLRIMQQQGALPQIVQHQRGQHDAVPGQDDRPAAEMTHVGEQGLDAREGEHDRAERQIAAPAVGEEEMQGRHRVHAVDGDRVRRQRGDAQGADGGEPQQHHRAEQLAHPFGAAVLEQEEGEQDPYRDRQDVGLEDVGRDIQALDRREHRYGRGDHAVAVEQGGAEQHEQDQHAGAAAGGFGRALLDQAEHGEGAALAVVVGAHDEQGVFQADGQDHRPDDQRHDAGNGRRVVGERRLVLEHLLDGVERAGADVAEDDAEGAQHQLGKRLVCGAHETPSAGRCGAASQTLALPPSCRRLRRGDSALRDSGDVRLGSDQTMNRIAP